MGEVAASVDRCLSGYLVEDVAAATSNAKQRGRLNIYSRHAYSLKSPHRSEFCAKSSPHIIRILS
jgi:hypothetical protein